MKINILIYKLTDFYGDIDWDCCQSPGDDICIGGYDNEYRYHQFDSHEAHHSYTWAETYGFKLECIEKEIEI